MAAVNPVLTDKARFSVITCSPGPDLYSLFGHSAFRLQDSIGGRWFDVVYNYGTFFYDEYFYVKFSQGKLDYVLETSHFDDFMQSYVQEGRGVWEQELLLKQSEKQRLFDLLQENVRRENCTYRYDFFYDNCSTRIRDMIIRAMAKEDTRHLGYRFVPIATLDSINTIDFPAEFPKGRTYRRAIQTYLDYQPWSDLGIDLALGLPCDDEAGPYGLMFLPDSLMKELQFATVNGELLCYKPVQLLPVNYELATNPWISPWLVLGLFLLIHLTLTIRQRTTRVKLMVTDYLLLLIAFLVGLLIVFLWFFTDHTATVVNWNILWANPLFVFFTFYRKLSKQLARGLAMLFFLSLTCVLVAYPFMSQEFHPTVFLLILGLMVTFGKFAMSLPIHSNVYKTQ